ncbi:sodium:solute symporter family protein [Melioribacter sp. Ez-97]|uniref:sodium:solute symporter family protein n=1 Tax=Melioribacter sp. Ez-97 TaxID=3423434 RepID=UPI003EDA8894
MDLSFYEWLIVAVVMSFSFYGVYLSKRHVKSVADFLSAGRSAGRYMITVSQGMTAIGAITIVGQWEMNYVAGFVLRWWEFIMAVVLLIVTVTGWVIYRFRQTRALTVAQFLEMRYSRNFRIYAGILAFISGLLNFGIFPAVSARFIIYFCRLPLSFQFLGVEVSTFPVTMALLLLVSLYFVFAGGQVAIIVTEFIQGVFLNITFIAILVFCLFFVNWDQIMQAVSTVPENASLINPFKASEVQDFNFWYFLINVVGIIYGKMSWQGGQGYYSSAKSAHEAKMGEVLANFRDIPRWLFYVFVPVVAFTILHHVDFSNVAEVVEKTLSGIDNKAVQNQLRVPLVLSEILPFYLRGALLAVMIMATVGTNSSYMHSWGSIFIQDVVMPFRKKKFSHEQHLKVLRYSILGVCVFIFLFSLFFPMTDYIFLYFAITAAIFVGGSGSVIIGGLYWKYGTTAAAWVSLTIGSAVAVSGIILQQIYPDFPINGQYFWAISMGVSSLSYILVSLLGKRQEFNMDKMLHRGKYAIKEESVVVNEVPLKGLRMLGIGKEFSRGDKLIYIVSYVWTFSWVAVFIIGTIWNLLYDVPDSVWLAFWRKYVEINLAASFVIIIWFILGGSVDFKDMMNRLKTMTRDYDDDGTVKDHNNE